jgi:hypothetical protein
VTPRESTVDAFLCKNLRLVLVVCTVTCVSLRGGSWTALATRNFVDGVVLAVGGSREVESPWGVFRNSHCSSVVEFDASVPGEKRPHVAVNEITSQVARHGETSGDIEAHLGAKMPNLDYEDNYSFRVQKTPTSVHDFWDWNSPDA